MEQPPKLLQGFALGELEAFETLFRQYQGEVYRWIVRIVRDPASAEDLTIETFWRIHRAHARFEAGRSFEAWARRIATNVAIDHLKRARPREEPLDNAGERLPTGAAHPAAHDRASHDPAVLREMRERTRQAFEQLPAKLRAVATLALIEQEPLGEIADVLNISPSAVKSRLFRAVRLLRRKLGNLDWTSQDSRSLDSRKADSRNVDSRNQNSPDPIPRNVGLRNLSSENPNSRDLDTEP